MSVAWRSGAGRGRAGVSAADGLCGRTPGRFEAPGCARRWRALAALAALLIAGCGRGGGEPGESEERPRPIVDVKIDSVRVGSIPELLATTGTTRALRLENVSSPVDGKLNALRVLEGDRVGKGDVLAVVETKESVAAVTGAQLLLARAQTPEEKVRAEADLDRARRNQTVLEIHAPFAGVVGQRVLNEGEFVSAGGTIVTVMDLSSLCFVARLPPRELSRVRLRQEAFVSFESTPARRWPCWVDNLKSQMDAEAQVAEVRLRFHGPSAELRSDMFGTAEIVVNRHENSFLVPDRAVLRDDETGNHSILEAVGDTLAIVRPVQVGFETPDTVELQGPGLRAGMHVIVEGNYGLPDSTRVHVQWAESAAFGSTGAVAPEDTAARAADSTSGSAARTSRAAGRN
jgi:membrane fusion protein, multidrug efflux system